MVAPEGRLANLDSALDAGPGTPATAAPMMMAVLWREVFTPVGAEPFDLQALAEQHALTALEGLKARAAA